MQKVLPIKTYKASDLKIVYNILKRSLKDLDVKLEKVELNHGWVSINLTGDDEKTAFIFLRKELGFCPTYLKDIKKTSIIKGYIRDLKEDDKELEIDIGIIHPKKIFAKINEKILQTQLYNGEKIPLKKITKDFGLKNNVPIFIKIIEINGKKMQINAEIAERQMKLFKDWIKTLLDRLIIMGASTREIKSVVKKTRLSRDIIDIEKLSLFEHILVFKLGTDAKGIIPKIGKKLPKAIFVVFNPKKIWKNFTKR